MSLQSFHWFWKEFNLSTLNSMSKVFNEWKSRHHLHDQGGLSSSCGHNERPSWTFKQNQSCSNSNRYLYWWRSGKNEIVCKIQFMTSVHLLSCFLYLDLSLHRVWHLCDLPCGGYRLISIVRYVLKVLAFKGQSLEYSMNMFQNKVDNWKPQADGHVAGPCRLSISRWKDL